jgi:hypothetical protein
MNKTHADCYCFDSFDSNFYYTILLLVLATTTGCHGINTGSIYKYYYHSGVDDYVTILLQASVLTSTTECRHY